MTSTAPRRYRWIGLAWVALAFCLMPVISEPEPTVRGELEGSAIPVIQHIRRYYIEEISADTLMQAGIRGLFQSLDPASDFTIREGHRGWKDNFAAFERIAHTIDSEAYYSVAADTLIRFGIGGIMSVLDRDSEYMARTRLENFRIHVYGEYGGLGFRIQVVYPDSAIAVWSLLHPETPAAKAAVLSGDLIVAIDDSSTVGMSSSGAADLMRGPAGEPVTLTLRRAGRDDPFDITIVREKVHVPSVPYYTLFADSTGYIRLPQFQQNCSAEVRGALEELVDAGMKRLIFDLRGNPGGFLDEAVKIADLFLPPNRLVVYTAGRAIKDPVKYFTTPEEPVFGEGPMVVLVDGLSASASEIVAGAVQDWDRGLVLGLPTVGKGSVQQTVPIDKETELKLTMAAYFIPSGRSIDKRMRKDSTLVAMADQDFHTRILGRLVRGAGGVSPDIQMKGRRSTPLFSQLNGWGTWDFQFFWYAREYPLHHPDITPGFVADDDVVEDFRQFVAERDFDYVSAIELRLNQLQDQAEEEEAHGRLAKHIKRLKNEIDDIEEDHWDANRDLLAWKLTYDILEKAFGIRAAHAYDVTVNPQIQRAKELLADEVEYESWFERREIGQPNKVIATVDGSVADSADSTWPTTAAKDTANWSPPKSE